MGCSASTLRHSGEEDNAVAPPHPSAPTDNAVALKGITLKGVLGLRAHLQQLCSSGHFDQRWDRDGVQSEGVQTFEELTTKQVVYTWVRSITGARCLADLHQQAPPAAKPAPATGFTGADVGRPTYFISHAWNGKVSKLLATIEDFLSNAIDSTSVWIDFVAICQNSSSSAATDSEALAFFVRTFEAVLQVCVGGTLVVVDMQACNPASRAWCIYEWDHTLFLHGPDGLHMHGMNTSELASIVGGINVDKAQCTKPSDLATIRGNIVTHHGSLNTFDTALRLQLVLDPLSYKVDLEQLERRSKETKWKWEEVKAWLQDPAAGRALCVLAGAGTGKSSISAAMLRQLLGQRDPERPGQWRGPLTAVHFLKYSDQRRLDAVSIIRSLVYQLAVRHEPAAQRILSLDPEALVSLHSVEDAFTKLLKPIMATMIGGPVIILIDALDEADPPEQLEPGFSGCVKAAGNKALGLVTAYLAEKLAANVRFVFTSRPDAACGGIEAVLRRAFGDGIRFLDPLALREPGPGSGGGGGGGELVAQAVLKEYQDQGLPLQCPPPEGAGEGGPEAHRVYAAAFDSAPALPPGQAASAQLLLHALVVAQEPLSHSTLQQLGLAAALPNLPGWGVLFFLVDHHVYLLHKSLSDWLRSPGPHAVDLQAGHRLLGTHLAQEVLKPSFTSASVLPTYTAKYAVLHLSMAGPASSQLLDSLLGSWVFLRKVCEAQQGGRMLRALSEAPPGSLSPYSHDAMRWLGLGVISFEDEPGSMEQATVIPGMAACSSFKYKEAAARLELPWVITQDLGGDMGAWPALLTTLSGQVGYSGLTVAFSPDGRQLATGSDGTANVWDLATGQCALTVTGTLALALSPDGRLLATGERRPRAGGLEHMGFKTCLWDLASGQRIATLEGSVSCTAFSPDGKQLATGGEEGVKLWELSSGQCIKTLAPAKQGGYRAPIRSIAFSPDGKLLATEGSGSTAALVWDLATAQCAMSLEGHEGVGSVAFGPDSRLLITGNGVSSGTGGKDAEPGGDAQLSCVARVWDLATGQSIATLKGHMGEVCVAFSPDGKHVATGGNHKHSDHTARVWDVASWQCIATVEGHRAGVCSVAFSPDSKQLATGSEDHTAKTWDMALLQSRSRLQVHKDDVICVALSSDGKLLATASPDCTAKIWDLENGQCVTTLEGVKADWDDPFKGVSFSCVAFSPDCKLLATGDELPLSHALKTRVMAMGGYTGILGGDAMAGGDESSGDDEPGEEEAPKAKVQAASNKAVKIWDVASGALVKTLEEGCFLVMCVAFSPDGKLLASARASAESTVEIWDVAAGQCITTLKGHKQHVSQLVFSPDGLHLGTAGRDQSARLWELATGQCSATFEGHNQEVFGIAFSPDGKQLATGSQDSTTKIWDLDTRTCTTTLESSCCVWSVAFSPDGKTLASRTWDSHITLWDLATGRCAASLQGYVDFVTEDDSDGPETFDLSTIAFSRDGQHLVTGSNDKTAKVWTMTEFASRLGAGAGQEEEVGLPAYPVGGRNQGRGRSSSSSEDSNDS